MALLTKASRSLHLSFIKPAAAHQNRLFRTTVSSKMPEPLKTSDVTANKDPSVTKQYDAETPVEKQISDFYGVVDKLKVALLTTQRQGLGPVSRSMAVARRTGPDFLFLANKNSTKFKMRANAATEDLDSDKTAQITFQDSSTQNWASITGKATVTDNSDPRIKDLHSAFSSAWFGDLGDGVHNGTADDPRVALIEVKADYITYWLSTSTKLGFLKEIAESTVTGQVATTGVTRELKKESIEKAREQK